MQRRVIGPALVVLGLMSAGGPSFAADSKAASESAAPQKAMRAAPVVPVDINSASRAQLKTLPGIGDAEASRIIAARPYLSKADLASRKVIPAGVYVSLKDRIIAIQKQKPKGKG